MTQPATILVVDDEPLFLRIYTSCIERAGFHVLTAEHGEQAWEMIQSDPTQIDIIISDVQMPGMDGYQLCERIRANDETQDIPFIFVSGLINLDEKLKGYAVGGDDYITKPVVPEELLEKVRHQLDIRIKNAGLSKQLAESFNAAMQAMTYSSQLGQVIDFFKKSLSAVSLQQIADYLFEFMEPIGLHSTIQFHTPQGLVNFGGQGEVSPLESSVIEMARQKPRFFDFGTRTIINYTDFSLLIKNMPIEDEERYGTIKDTLGNLCEAIEARVTVLLSEDRNKQREQILKTVQEAMDGIAGSLDSIQKANVTVIEEMINDIDSAMMVLGLTEEQEQDIRGIASKTLTRVDEAFNQGAMLRKQFAAVQSRLAVIFSCA